MITQIRLINFKCFNEENFDILPLTLLTGINGVGKSSVIQSLLLLKQSFNNNYLQTQHKVTLNNSFINLENCDQLCYKKAYPKTVEIDITNKSGELYKWQIDASDPDEIEPSIQFIGNESFDKEPLFNEDFIYLSSERIGPRKLYNKTSIEKRFNTKLGIHGELAPAYIQNAVTENSEVLIADLIHPSIRETVDPHHNKSLLYTNLNAWISDILGKSTSVKVSSVDKENLSLTFSLKGANSGVFSSLQVGFGFSFSLPVILAPLISKPGDLIIIENPEAHLHPSAQVKIGKFLAIAAKNGVQIIIETHSDHVLNGIRLAVKEELVPHDDVKIFFFGEKEDKYFKVEPNIDKDGRIDKWPRDFFDSWEFSLMQLM